jgi:hypothetical protein
MEESFFQIQQFLTIGSPRVISPAVDLPQVTIRGIILAR